MQDCHLHHVMFSFFFFCVGGSGHGLKPFLDFPFLYPSICLCTHRPVSDICKHLPTLRIIWSDFGLSYQLRFYYQLGGRGGAVGLVVPLDLRDFFSFSLGEMGELHQVLSPVPVQSEQLQARKRSYTRGTNKPHTNIQRNAERLMSEILQRNCEHQSVPMKSAAEWQLWSLLLHNTPAHRKNFTTSHDPRARQTYHSHSRPLFTGRGNECESFTQERRWNVGKNVLKGGVQNSAATAVTALWAYWHDFPQLTAGRIISGGLERSPSH